MSEDLKPVVVKEKTNRDPYEQAFYPPEPTGFTRFMRTFFIWQICRFIWINLKMVRIISKSHHQK